LEKDELERLASCSLRLSFEEIVSHPRLPEARRPYLKSFSEVYGGDPFLVRLLLQAGRFFVFHSAAVLEAAQDPSRRETWFTVAALKQQLAMFGYASPRQIDHLLARPVGLVIHLDALHRVLAGKPANALKRVCVCGSGVSGPNRRPPGARNRRRSCPVFASNANSEKAVWARSMPRMMKNSTGAWR